MLEVLSDLSFIIIPALQLCIIGGLFLTGIFAFGLVYFGIHYLISQAKMQCWEADSFEAEEIAKSLKEDKRQISLCLEMLLGLLLFVVISYLVFCIY